MSKYSITGTEIVNDSGQIDWSKIINVPTHIVGVANTVESVGNAGTYSSEERSVQINVENKIRYVLRIIRNYCACDCACG